jgi:hypothetical protein
MLQGLLIAGRSRFSFKQGESPRILSIGTFFTDVPISARNKFKLLTIVSSFYVVLVYKMKEAHHGQDCYDPRPTDPGGQKAS